MNSSLQNPSSSNPHTLQKDVSSPDHQVALELERLHELRRQVAAQEQKLQSLRQQAANSEDSHSLCKHLVCSLQFEALVFIC